MPLVEHALYVQVRYPNNSRAPFTCLRIDAEFQNQAGEAVRAPVAEIEDDSREFPYLIQYKLKKPDATLWLVLVDGDKEERQRVSVEKHRYFFPNSADSKQVDHRTQSEAGNITHNYFFKEVTVSKYDVKAENVGALGDNAKAENVTQNDNRQMVSAATDLSALLKELPTLIQSLAQQAKTSEQFQDIAHVKAAEEAAHKNDLPGAMSKLRGVGSWVLEVAKSVGAEIVAKVITTNMGVG